jgi:hypothetical protein
VAHARWLVFHLNDLADVVAGLDSVRTPKKSAAVPGLGRRKHPVMKVF